MERYRAEPLRLYDLMSEFLVHCPKCDGKADITIPQYFDYKNGILKCTSCHFSEKASERIRYKPTGKAKCHHCLEFLDLKSIKEHKSVPAYVNVKCTKCKN